MDEWADYDGQARKADADSQMKTGNALCAAHGLETTSSRTVLEAFHPICVQGWCLESMHLKPSHLFYI